MKLKVLGRRMVSNGVRASIGNDVGARQCNRQYPPVVHPGSALSGTVAQHPSWLRCLDRNKLGRQDQLQGHSCGDRPCWTDARRASSSLRQRDFEDAPAFKLTAFGDIEGAFGIRDPSPRAIVTAASDFSYGAI